MKKGRNQSLIQLRNEALCRRYYYWTEIKRLRFDDALQRLSLEEFFLSEERIMCILREEYPKMQADGRLQKSAPKRVRPPRFLGRQMELFPTA